MALINCPECGREMSDAATACPHCGMPLHAAKPPALEEVNTKDNPPEVSVPVAATVIIIAIILIVGIPTLLYYLPQDKSKRETSTASRPSSSSVFVAGIGTEYVVKEWVYVYPTKAMPVSKEEMVLTAMTIVYPGDIVRVLDTDWNIVGIRLVKHDTYENEVAYITRNILKTYFRKR